MSRGGDAGARPNSRGGPGMSMAGGGMRPMTGARPGTGMKPPGSRMGTARAGPVNMSGVGLNTSMNISERPVTQQGLSGMPRTAANGPQRQILDNSYYLQLLRAKCTEIMKEINTLKGNVEQGQRDNAAYGQLERKYETLTNDMRELQGQLADYNLFFDRSVRRRLSAASPPRAAPLALPSSPSPVGRRRPARTSTSRAPRRAHPPPRVLPILSRLAAESARRRRGAGRGWPARAAEPRGPAARG